MRQKRAKTYRKLMSLYSLTFGFREPYQVLGAHGQARPCFVNELTRLYSGRRILQRYEKLEYRRRQADLYCFARVSQAQYALSSAPA
jgi:hypothetical protein